MRFLVLSLTVVGEEIAATQSSVRCELPKLWLELAPSSRVLVKRRGKASFRETSNTFVYKLL